MCEKAFLARASARLAWSTTSFLLSMPDSMASARASTTGAMACAAHGVWPARSRLFLARLSASRASP